MLILPTNFINSSRKKSIFFGLFLCVLLLVLLVVWQSAKSWSYAKLTPYKVSFSVLSQNDIILNVQYDYGYRFIEGHVQPLRIVGNDDFQEVVMSISAWKQVKNLRFSSPNDPEHIGIKLLQVSLQGSNVLSESKLMLASKGTSSVALAFENEAPVNLPFIVRNLGY